MKCPKCGREMRQTLQDPFSYFCRYCCKVWELKEKQNVRVKKLPKGVTYV